MKNIPIYTIYKAQQDPDGEGYVLGAKDTVMSWHTVEAAAEAMFTQAKNLEQDGYIHILKRNRKEGESDASLEFLQKSTGDTYIQWVVQEFLIVPDDCNL